MVKANKTEWVDAQMKQEFKPLRHLKPHKKLEFKLGVKEFPHIPELVIRSLNKVKAGMDEMTRDFFTFNYKASKYEIKVKSSINVEPEINYQLGQSFKPLCTVRFSKAHCKKLVRRLERFKHVSRPFF